MAAAVCRSCGHAGTPSTKLTAEKQTQVSDLADGVASLENRSREPHPRVLVGIKPSEPPPPSQTAAKDGPQAEPGVWSRKQRSAETRGQMRILRMHLNPVTQPDAEKQRPLQEQVTHSSCAAAHAANS